MSGGVGRHRQMPICPTLSVVCCRRLSPCVGGHWGKYWGSLCLRERSSPCSEDPIRGRTPLRYGLIRRLFLAEPVRSARAMPPRILRCKRLRPSRSVPLRSPRLLAVLLAEEASPLPSNRTLECCVDALIGASQRQLAHTQFPRNLRLKVAMKTSSINRPITASQAAAIATGSPRLRVWGKNPRP